MHHFLRLSTTMPSPSSSSSKPFKSAAASPNPNSHHHHHSAAASSGCSAASSATCKHSPSATLDLLILLLVLFSGTFLLTSYFSYIFNSLSLLLAHYHLSFSFSLHLSPSFPYILGFVALFLLSVASACCGARSRKCHRPGCKGIKNAMEFDLQLQTEEILKSTNVGSSPSSADFDKLPWKGGSEANPDYECLRRELRKMAPPNGRAVLLFRAKCGCPVAKLEGWGPRRGRRQKK
ncbi:hypothetical protein Tsubulata_004658 [Turnera subulata]|uniref:Ribosomal protein L34e superfamily protein n=1 Tax=Turnera subulata TaxID=218843 RepID=A0A9Q0JLL0_9ROSI|nr:hypothetical protein Tsubulata_004658 [Turnera subulata]